MGAGVHRDLQKGLPQEAIVCKSGVVYRPAMHGLSSARLTVIFFLKSPDREAHIRRRS